MITKQEVLDAQDAWAKGIVEIGSIFMDHGDYKLRAEQHIKDLYAYEQGKVLFKPTLASAVQFRSTYSQALSYFVGGEIAEDQGFAIRPWSKVRFGEQQIITDREFTVAMGNYFMTAHGSDEELKVEFTFGYIRDREGQVRINVHHSSFPYQPDA